MPNTNRVCFGGFSFEPVSGELWRGSERVPLEHQPAVLLARLLATPGELVTRDDLAAALWGTGTHVCFDDGLNYCVRAVRVALGDDAKAPRFIATVPRRGYRFVAAVRGTSSVSASSRTPWRLIAVAAAIVLVAIAETIPNNHHDTAVAVARAVHDLLF